MTGGYRPFDGDDWLGRELPLAGGPYRIVAESAFDVAEEMAFARQGRKARVFKLLDPDGAPYALKAFYRGFSRPENAPITESLRAFGEVPGLRTCQRRVIGQVEAEVVDEPGLTYAVLMPWIEGVAWAGVVERRFPLPAGTGLALAARTATVLAEVEARGLTHADVSSTNVVVTDAEHGPGIELIDVEDMYHESFPALPYVPDGSPGYAHPRNSGRGCRNPHGDRFAGAVLLTEMLVWHDSGIRASTADISVFDQTELGRSGGKYALVRKLLQAQSPQVATLFERAWDSPVPAACPRLAEWAAAIPTVVLPEPADERATDQDAGLTCPGCGEPLKPEVWLADHASNCPLRTRSVPASAFGRSAFPGVPTNEGITFVPLFDA